MGTYLSSPNKEKDTLTGSFRVCNSKNQKESVNVPFVVSSMQGWRKTMEDAHISDVNLENRYEGVPQGTSLFAVFDGHAGCEVSEFCSLHFGENLVDLEAFKAKAYREALIECFHKMDELLQDSRYGEELAELRNKAHRQPSNLISEMLSESERARSLEDIDESEPGSDRLELGNPDDTRGYTEDSDTEDEIIKGDQEDAILGLDKIVEDPRRESLNPRHFEQGSKILQEEIKKKEAQRVQSSSTVGTKPDEEAVPNDPKSVSNPSKQEIDEVNEELSPLPKTVQDTVSAAEERGGLEKTEALEIFRELLTKPTPNFKFLTPLRNLVAGETGKKDEEEDKTSENGADAWRDEVYTSKTKYTTAGTTALVALVVAGKLYVANAGDSRGVLCDGGRAVALSFDHKPFNQTEKARIEGAGGFVSKVGRVCGNLNLSRCIGDLKYKANDNIPRDKQIITAEPDVTVRDIGLNDLFFVLACDGVYDVLTNDALINFVKEKLLQLTKTELKEIEETNNLNYLKVCVEDMFERCISDDPGAQQGLGGDNMTCVIVFLKPIDIVIEALQKQ